MNYYYNETTGIAMISGVALGGVQYTGSTGILSINGQNYTGRGQVYGILWDTGNISFGLAPHTTGIKINPSATGKIFYPKPDIWATGSGIILKFEVNIWSGLGIVLSGIDSRLSGINSGLSGDFLPSGYLLHKESYKLLPNYAFPSSNVYTGDYVYPSSSLVGGIYPSLLQDNIININLEMTWSGDCGTASNC